MGKSEKLRNDVISSYKVLLGRNIYNQGLRDYCYRKYKDGNYYSDCSSSVSYAYKEAKCGFGILNTVGMYLSKKFTVVDVKIIDGQIIPSDYPKLRIGDMLLYAGTDINRAYAGYVGHVEMIYSINGNNITLCGHPSGSPRLTDMKVYCSHMYNSKTKTKRGNRGLLRVLRYIQDDSDSYSYEEFINDMKKIMNVPSFTAKGLFMKLPTLSSKINKNHKLVTPLERYMKFLGYYDGAVEEDEGKIPVFGSGLTKAVKQYQKEVVKAIPKNIDGEITARNDTWKHLLQF